MKAKWSPSRLSLLPAVLGVWLVASAIAAQWVDPATFLLAMGLLAFVTTLAVTGLFRWVNWVMAVLSILVYGLVQVGLRGWSQSIYVPLLVVGIAILGVALLGGLMFRQNKQVGWQFEQDQKLIEELRVYDPVTGLLGFQSAVQSLRAEIARCQRYNKPLCMLLAQIENQSKLEEELGQPGFQVLKRQIAGVMTDSLRVVDIGFVSGDRIGAILPETRQEGTQVVVKRILERVTRKAQVGLNVGIVQFPSDGVTENELVSSAEAALHMSQSSGQPFVSFSQVKEVASKGA